jgi:hypothetical protein
MREQIDQAYFQAHTTNDPMVDKQCVSVCVSPSSSCFQQ